MSASAIQDAASNEPIELEHHVRFVTAASLFDGHDAAINVMRRILQRSGAEVIHLGHNRSVAEIVDAAIEEDAQGIAISSYQGGHVEFFKYMVQLLEERGAGHIQVFGGGGGVIVPREIRELEASGVSKIFSPEDGRRMGLQGMINYMLERTDFDTTDLGQGLPRWSSFGRAIAARWRARSRSPSRGATGSWASASRSAGCRCSGITGTGGAGKSSLTDELVRRFLARLRGGDAGDRVHRPGAAALGRGAVGGPDPDELDERWAGVHALDVHARLQGRAGRGAR